MHVILSTHPAKIKKILVIAFQITFVYKFELVKGLVWATIYYFILTNTSPSILQKTSSSNQMFISYNYKQH